MPPTWGSKGRQSFSIVVWKQTAIADSPAPYLTACIFRYHLPRVFLYFLSSFFLPHTLFITLWRREETTSLQPGEVLYKYQFRILNTQRALTVPLPCLCTPGVLYKNLSLTHISATVFIPRANSGLSAARHFSNSCGNATGIPTQLQNPAEGTATHTCIETEPFLTSDVRVGSSPPPTHHLPSALFAPISLLEKAHSPLRTTASTRGASEEQPRVGPQAENEASSYPPARHRPLQHTLRAL